MVAALALFAFLPLFMVFIATVTVSLLLRCGKWFLLREDVKITARRRLVELGFPLCVYCGYDLRAATGKICPECGREPYPGVFRVTGKRASQPNQPNGCR